MFPTLPVFEQPKTDIVIAIVRPAVEKPKANPKTYRVKKGDTLIKIAKAHRVSWKRIWYKNVSIKHPDKITAGKRLILPEANEKLKKRNLPTIRQANRPARSAIIRRAISTAKLSAISPRISGGYSSSGLRSGYYPGNTYTPGQCTYGVKMWRPGIPNGWGNAYEWWSSAGAMGWPRGFEPRVGAVAVTERGGGHVGLVVSVQGDTVTFKDMNGNYVPWAVGYRTIPKYSYKYIY